MIFAVYIVLASLLFTAIGMAAARYGFNKEVKSLFGLSKSINREFHPDQIAELPAPV